MQLDLGAFHVDSVEDLPFLLSGLNLDSLLCAPGVDLAADKDRELGEAQAEIRALRLSERLREKAVEEVILIISPPECLFLELFEIMPYFCENNWSIKCLSSSFFLYSFDN